jgi:hypothetical protein
MWSQIWGWNKQCSCEVSVFSHYLSFPCNSYYLASAKVLKLELSFDYGAGGLACLTQWKCSWNIVKKENRNQSWWPCGVWFSQNISIYHSHRTSTVHSRCGTVGMCLFCKHFVVIEQMLYHFNPMKEWRKPSYDDYTQPFSGIQTV